MYRKSVTGTAPPHLHSMKGSSSLSAERHENASDKDDLEDADSSSPAERYTHHRMYGDDQSGSREKLINCDDLEIERHQPDRNRSPLLLLLLRRLCTCSPYFSKFFSALFYAVASFLIVVLNKIVLTNYRYVQLQSLLYPFGYCV